MSENKLHIPPVSLIDKIFDKAMVPLMWALGGFKNDSIQETHAWHAHDIPYEKIDKDLAVEFHGDDETKRGHGGLFTYFLFHAPIFGGWKKYVVLGHDLLEDVEWHIGWHVIHKETGETAFAQINKLKLKDRKVKMLKGSDKYITRWFAFTHDGQQIKLKHHDDGIHGDKKHKKLRLF